MSAESVEGLEAWLAQEAHTADNEAWRYESLLENEVTASWYRGYAAAMRRASGETYYVNRVGFGVDDVRRCDGCGTRDASLCELCALDVV